MSIQNPRVYVQNVPVCTFKTSPCVRSKRPRVYVQNVPVCTLKTSPCVPAPRTHVVTHGNVLNGHTDAFLNPHTGFSRFFIVPQHTNTHHDHQQHHDHNDTHHTTQHTSSRGDRERQRKKTEKERDRREKRRDKMKKREKMKGKNEREDRGYFLKKCENPPNQPDELAQNVSKRKNLSDELFLHFLRQFRV